MRTVLERSFGLDYRSLALFRIALGLVITGDLIDRAHDLRNHYTDDAVVYGHPFWLNPYLLNGSFFFTSILFCIHGVAGLLLCLGYYTRFMILLVWILQAALQARNISVGHGGDIYFRCLLFWCLFLPLSKVWSIDRYLADQESPPRQHKSTYFLGAASAAYLLQPTFMYTLAYYLKTHEYWTTSHIAAYYALRLEYFSDGMPIGQFFLRNPHLLLTLTWTSLVWEGYGSLLYFSPLWNGPLRLLGAVGMIALHLGFSMSLRLGTFCWITVSAQLAVFPDWFWDQILPLLRRLFPLLNRTVLRSCSYLMRSLALFDQVRHTFYSSILLRRPSLPTKSRRVGYLRWCYIARRVCVSLFIAVMCVSALGWNLNTMFTEGKEAPPRVTDQVYWLGERVGLDQNWGMFAPRPPEGDYWFAIECLSVSGDPFELFRNGGLFTWEGSPMSFDIPVPFIRPWYNHRWSKYWETYVDKNYELVRPDLVRWICNEWNSRHNESMQLAMFDVWIVEHGHLLNGSNADWGHTHMWHGECFVKDESRQSTEGADVGVEQQGEEVLEGEQAEAQQQQQLQDGLIEGLKPEDEELEGVEERDANDAAAQEHMKEEEAAEEQF